LNKKKKRFPRRSSTVRGSNYIEKKNEQKTNLNCKKLGHSLFDSLDLQKDKPKKESSKNENFKHKVKKILMETWEDLDVESDE